MGLNPVEFVGRFCDEFYERWERVALIVRFLLGEL